MNEARETFEKWYASNFVEKFVNIGAQLEKRGDQYVDFHAQDMFEVWQAQQKRIDDAENYLHVALNSVDDEILCKSYLLSAVKALRGES